MEVTALYRHPIKAHGVEAVPEVTLIEGQSMPFDRLWAIAHDRAKLDGTAWAACANFNRAARIPLLNAISAKLDEKTERVALSHPDLPTITLHPDRESDALLEWLEPLTASRALPRPDRVVRLDRRGFTDTDFPSISLCNIASHRAVESIQMAPLSPLRWRGNIWFEGAAAWSEHEWSGKEIRIGEAVLSVVEPATRCKATMANPVTGERDVDVLHCLNILGHQNFGVYARVIKNGKIAVGSTLELI